MSKSEEWDDLFAEGVEGFIYPDGSVWEELRKARPTSPLFIERVDIADFMKGHSEYDGHR